MASSHFHSLFSRSTKQGIMPPNITIRNITSSPLTLVQVEHFDPNEKRFQIHHVTKVFANATNSIGLTNHTTRADVPQISPDAKPFETRDVNIPIPPFTAVGTDIAPQINKPDERLRLTFQVEGEGGGGRHQMYCPVPTTETSNLAVIGDDPGHKFSGIYFPDTAYVALYSSADLNAWMGKLPDETTLGALSIPGTHNSPTCHNAPPSVRCQAVPPWDQLMNGVRFFDIRVQVPEPFDPNSDKLNLVHSVFPISLTGNKHFRDLYDDVRRFLDENRSETVVMSLKKEGSGKGTDEQLSVILKNHYTNPDQWFTEPRVPNLGEARSKIVLVRRFNLDDSLRGEYEGRGWGIDGAAWADNTPNSLCPSGDLCIQDFYEVAETPSIDQKISYVDDHLERSGCCNFTAGAPDQKMPMYVNFLSASNFWKVGTWPEKIAARVNPAVTEHLCRKHMLDDQGNVKEGDWSTGVVVCDWVGLGGDWDLVRCIVGMNAKLQR